MNMKPGVLLLCYDIAESGRWRKVFDICKSYGEHLQFSVFRMTLTASARVQLMTALEEAINHAEDRVLVIYLGPDTPNTQARFHCLGTQHSKAGTDVTII